jgi:hypothetical protein
MKHQLIKSYVDWLKDYNWKYFVALHFKADFKVNKRLASMKVIQLGTRLHRLLNGTQTNIQLSLFAVYEISNSNVPHVHIFIGPENESNKNIDEIQGAIAYHWGKLTGCLNPLIMGNSNSDWFKNTDENKANVIGYMCKEFKAGHDPVLVEALKLPSTK